MTRPAGFSRELRLRGPRILTGAITVPGDKSVSHRALLFAAIAEGTSLLRGLSDGADVGQSLAAIRALGAEVEELGGGTVRVTGGGLHEPATVLDTGNSGTGIRLLAGLAAGLGGLTVLHGDASIAGRPMDRIVLPLRQMGAQIDGRAGGRFPPLAIRGGGLRGIDHTSAVASAQVKSAVLIAGLGADGETVVREPVRRRCSPPGGPTCRSRAAPCDFGRHGWRRGTRRSRATPRRRLSGWSGLPLCPAAT
jgi:3-phosphoshikimate 1-carboxyvinyltransferase